MRSLRRAGLLLCFAVFLLQACPSPQNPATPSPTPLATSPTPRPTATRPEEALAPLTTPITLLDDGDVSSLRQAVQESKIWYGLQLPGRVFTFGPRTATAEQMKQAMQDIQEMLLDNPAPAVLSSRLTAEFDVLEATGGDTGACMFTGYYEPIIDAAKTKGHGYLTPIYTQPDDSILVRLNEFELKNDGKLVEGKLVGRVDGKKLVPYWKRSEINAGKMGKHAKVIGWAKDPVDLFIVQVQGSGALHYPDGSERRIGYDGANGFSLRSPARLLIENGSIPREKMSMQAMRAWFDAHPADVPRMLEYDDSYVFFRYLDTPPVGVLGRPVTPGRSIATDTKLFPGGALAYLDTTKPVAVATSADGVAWVPMHRFVLNQDTGGAIKGAGRADFFWGRGPDAAFSAGLMKQPGRMFFFVPKSAPLSNVAPAPALTP